ncbi:WAG22 antigen-like [Parasteatoda tepidariorum]|uniref:WAG22 antigen-like n=1 Tax=Parasteatoda tepidariorum TaxID=114398 RepID=UPI001C720989|nr:shematrin-like protein 2 isoform X2 [Parasteatoda tepidariorum]XP_015930578.2 shematrin-like protein 2 isoform X3 [Parasteatoda tepidariorum]XP_042904016.1 shematrin-like protein 2 isoform X1 [Parasteatoda tepidariorum]
MKLVVSLLTLLVVSNIGAQRIKGGGGLLTSPRVFGGKVGGGGGVHHTAVVQDPLSGAPVVVSKVSPIGGVKGGGLGAGSVQLSVGDGLFGNRGLYRVGQSQIPYGLLGMDYGSYPASLLTAPRSLRRKTIVSDNLSGLRPVGFGRRLAGPSKIGGGGALHHTAVVQDPLSGAPVVVSKVSPIGGVKGGGLGAGSVQLSVGDGLFGNRGLYRVGQSQIPYGLLGMDYGSYPTSLLTGRRGLGKTILSDNLSGLRPVGFGGKLGGGGAVHHTAVVQDPLSGAPVVVSKVSPIGGVKGGGLGAGSVQLSVGDGLFGNRGLYRVGQSQIPYGLLGMDYGSYPTSLLTGRRGLGKTILSDNLSGLRPVGFGGKLGGGGAVHHTAVVQDPLSGAPVVVSKVSPIGGVKGGGLGAGSIQLSVGDGLFGNRGLYRVGQSQVPFGLLGMDYGSYPTSFLTGRRGLSKTILSDNLSGLRPVGYGGKIGGLATGGLAGIGATQTTIVQEEDPFTGAVTTSQISQVAQDPIETAIQETLADAALSQSVQSLVDPLGSGQTQVSVDDFGGVTQVKETIVSDPLTGELNKVTEVTKSGGGLAQQNIADAIVQENIASGLGRANLGAYLPRLSFLSQYPYDFSDAGALRSIVSRPLIQQQQEVEQILVK